MTNTPAASTASQAFGTAAQTGADHATPSARWIATRALAQGAAADAEQSIKAATEIVARAAAEKDSGLRYMSANLLRDLGSQQSAAAEIAAEGIAALATKETDAYARRSMELALADLATAQPQTAPIAAAAIAANLSKGGDALTRSLQAGQLTTLVQQSPAIGVEILAPVSKAFDIESEKLAAHHLSRTLVAIAADDNLRQPVVAKLMDAMTAAPTTAHPLEKTFAAAQALHQISTTHPQEIAAAMADRLESGKMGNNGRRLCILGLSYAAEATPDGAAIAAPTLLKALPQENDALLRRHIVDGVMKSVHNGFAAKEAGAALFAHLSAKNGDEMLERDRETREKISSTLRRLGHRTPAAPQSIPAPR